MTIPFTQDVTLIARAVTGRDSYGDDVFTETETVVSGLYVPGGSVEMLGGQDQITTQPKVYLPADTALTGVDAVRVEGVRYEVDGTPQRWPANPWTGWLPPLPVVVQLRQVSG